MSRRIDQELEAQVGSGDAVEEPEEAAQIARRDPVLERDLSDGRGVRVVDGHHRDRWDRLSRDRAVVALEAAAVSERVGPARRRPAAVPGEVEKDVLAAVLRRRLDLLPHVVDGRVQARARSGLVAPHAVLTRQVSHVVEVVGEAPIPVGADHDDAVRRERFRREDAHAAGALRAALGCRGAPIGLHGVDAVAAAEEVPAGGQEHRLPPVHDRPPAHRLITDDAARALVDEHQPAGMLEQRVGRQVGPEEPRSAARGGGLAARLTQPGAGGDGLWQGEDARPRVPGSLPARRSPSPASASACLRSGRVEAAVGRSETRAAIDTATSASRCMCGR